MHGQCPLGFVSIAQTHILEVYSDINEQFQVLDYVRKGKTFMTDKGFNITDPYHKGGILHTRAVTPTKFNSLFVETEIAKVDQVLASDLSQPHVRLTCCIRDWK